METLWWLIANVFTIIFLLCGLAGLWMLVRLRLKMVIALAVMMIVAGHISGCSEEKSLLASMTPEQQTEYFAEKERKAQEEKAAEEAEQAEKRAAAEAKRAEEKAATEAKKAAEEAKKAEEEAAEKAAKEAKEAKAKEAAEIAKAKKDAEIQREADARRLKQQQIDSIRIGDPISKVREIQGAPRSTDTVTSAYGEQITYYYSGYIYVFDNGVLSAIRK